MKAIDLFLEMLFNMLTFKKCTTFQRWFEISCGVLAWLQIGIIFWGITK